MDWNAVVELEVELAEEEGALEFHLENRELVEAGGLQGLLTRLTAGSVAALDRRIESALSTVERLQTEVASAEEQWRATLASDDKRSADDRHRRRAVDHAIRVLRSIQNDATPMTPVDVALIRRAVTRVQRTCAALEDASHLPPLLARVEKARRDAATIRWDIRYLAIRPAWKQQEDLGVIAEEREDVTLLAAEEPLLRMARELDARMGSTPQGEAH